MCFAQVMDSPTASVLIFVYLVVGVVILMNMLIAMMAKTFDSVFENSERNYMVMRVKFFVAYDDSDWPAPLNGLGMPWPTALYLGSTASACPGVVWASGPPASSKPPPLLGKSGGPRPAGSDLPSSRCAA